MGACVSQPEQEKEIRPQHTDDSEEEVMVSRTHTGSMSAFAAVAAQVCSEPESPPVLSLQPILTRVAQLQPCQDPLEAKAAPAQTLLKDLRRAATAPHIAPAVARISPWAAMDAPARASTVSVAAPLTVATIACQSPEPAPFYPPSKEEHRAQLVQLLEDACRHQSVDWKVLRCSLQKARSADAPDVDVPLPAQSLMRDTPATSFLRMASSGRHDSASSSIEPRRPSIPASPRTPKVPVLGRMGTAGSMPVYSYDKPVPEPSCPEFLRMLSAEGRSAYAQWRGEEDSCRLEDLNSACDAAISSLSTMSCDSWLEIDSSPRNQSLFYGADNDVRSPFEGKIPAHIQRSLSSPTDPQPAMPQPGKATRHRASADQARSMIVLTNRNTDLEIPIQRGCKASSIPANRFRDVHLQFDSGCRKSLQFSGGYQSPMDGRLMRPPHTSSAGGLSARPPLPRQASGN